LVLRVESNQLFPVDFPVGRTDLLRKAADESLDGLIVSLFFEFEMSHRWFVSFIMASFFKTLHRRFHHFNMLRNNDRFFHGSTTAVLSEPIRGSGMAAPIC
jgi:hypothetical protein